jgi:hypothetical protein
MKPKAEVRLDNENAESEGLVRRSLSRARVQLSQALPTRGKARETAFSRMRELLEQDRVRLAKPGSPYATPGDQGESADAAEPAPVTAVTARESVLPTPKPTRSRSKAEPPPLPSRRSTPSSGLSAAAVTPPTEEGPSDPIRTRTMARLLAIQGYRKRALSIYDELLAQTGDDDGLRAEADRLRS